MVNKTPFAIIVLALIIIVCISNVFAITASIGNARMILKANVSDIIDKTILVKNVNDVPVLINLKTSGDLEKYITIKENNFTLEPGEEKKVGFSIKVAKNGTTESKIDVSFTPIGEKNGVGLSSTIIVIAGGEEAEDTNTKTNTNTNNNNQTNPIKFPEIKMPVIKIGIIGWSFIITGIIFLVFIILVIIYYRKNLNQMNNNNYNVHEKNNINENIKSKGGKINTKKSAQGS